jgi:hypothetical protein
MGYLWRADDAEGEVLDVLVQSNQFFGVWEFGAATQIMLTRARRWAGCGQAPELNTRHARSIALMAIKIRFLFRSALGAQLCRSAASSRSAHAESVVRERNSKLRVITEWPAPAKQSRIGPRGRRGLVTTRAG